jgi:hypothetical protein
MYVSPRRPPRIAANTVSTASSSVRRNRVMSDVVIVTGPPLLICSWKSGMTDPRDASTFPYRTHTKRVSGQVRFADVKTRS